MSGFMRATLDAIVRRQCPVPVVVEHFPFEETLGWVVLALDGVGYCVDYPGSEYAVGIEPDEDRAKALLVALRTSRPADSFTVARVVRS